MKNLLAQISKAVLVSAELEAAIEAAFRKEQIRKQDCILKEYDHVRKLYFIDEGLLRTYYIHDGKEVTSWFYSENQFITSWHGFYRQVASHEYIEALVDCTVFSIEYIKYQQLIDTFQKFERFSRLLAEEQLAFIDSYSKGYLYMSAKDKYDHLLSYVPDIELRVKLGHIASFLGISQETLSRIRKR